MLNFCQWFKTRSSAFSHKFSATTPNFCTFSVEPLVIYNCALYTLKILEPCARYSTFKYPVTLKPGLGSLRVIGNITVRQNAYDFLLTFISNYGSIYPVSFLRYSMSKNVVTLKSGSKVTQGHWEWYHWTDCVWFAISVL